MNSEQMEFGIKIMTALKEIIMEDGYEVISIGTDADKFYVWMSPIEKIKYGAAENES